MVNRIVTESCYKTLGDAASQMTTLLENQVEADREQLEVITAILSAHDDISSQEAYKHLASFQQKGMVSSLAVLLPDNEMVFCNEESFKQQKALDFAEEVKKAPYISGVCKAEEGGRQFLYQAVPVIKNEETVGILYGFINLETMKSKLPVTAFNDTAQFFVIDGSNGDFIIDTWHEVPGAVQDDALEERKIKFAKSFEEVNQSIRAGETGHFAFLSQNVKEYFYAYYMPTGINRWSVMITAPEREAFASAQRIRYAMYFLATVDVIALFVYFLWILSKVRSEASQKEERLRQTLFMFDVQQALFDSYRHPERITAALEKTAEILTAEKVFLVNMDGNRMGEICSWPEQGSSLKDKDIEELFPQISGKLLQGEAVLLYEDRNGMLPDSADRIALETYKVHNIMIVPVMDSEHCLTGFMGGANMARRWEDGSILEGIARTFLMAQKNVNSYQLIQKMGMWDALTGLKNRNSYQQTLKKYTEGNHKERLGCIYIDVNGLHELNNHLGHAAGDKMLSFAGSTLAEIFGYEDAYRIGGDEFVVFCRHMSREAAKDRISQLNARMEALNYHLSVGLAWQEMLSNINLLVAEAEQEMYEAKRKYYQEKSDAGKYRDMNRKLEQILLEKKDSDTFLSIISSYFKGVYVVNLDTDELRVIYKPSYFAEQLKATNYKFMAALRLYADSFVYEEDRCHFYSFLNYEEIGRKLTEGENPQLEYRKQDGTGIILRVFPAADYGTEKKETLWLFEEIND